MTLHEVDVGAKAERDVVKYGTRRCRAAVTGRDEHGTYVHYVGEAKPVLLPKDDPGPEGWTAVKDVAKPVSN
jgi:hypothetical protein